MGVGGQVVMRACCRFCCVQLFVILWTVALKAPPSMRFSRQEYWSGLPCPPPGGLPDPGIESSSHMSPALAGGFFTTTATWEAQFHTLSRSNTVASNVTLALFTAQFALFSLQWLRLSHLGQHIRSEQGLPGGASSKEPACQCRRLKRHEFSPWVGTIPWRRAWQPTPVSLPGESHCQRNLVGYSPQGSKESDMTEACTQVPTFTLKHFNFLYL